MQEIIFPPPGSDKSIAQGCTCPVWDNCHGRGYGADWMKYGWIVQGDCPLHGRIAEEIAAAAQANNHQ